MPNYRDYGAINGATPPLPTEINTAKFSQVYSATHEGSQRLPYMNRSFMSFSYDGKNIEDFNLLAVIENNSLQRKLYGDFSDNVSESDVWDGQIYWSSHFNNNSLNFVLFTDGINELQLDEFKRHFAPKKVAELILAEHPNRAIMARVAAPPEMSMLPYEEQTSIMVMGQEYQTSTTSYRGSINLSFIMDEPFWHSKVNILDELYGAEYRAGKWIDANGNEVQILDDKDALKIIKEDGVPFSYMFDNGGDASDLETILVGTEKAIAVDISTEGVGSRLAGANGIEGARVGEGRAAYIILNDDAGITIGPNTYGYFYYAGNAPCHPIITFSLTPTIDDNTGYINLPANTYAGGTNYNTITIECLNTESFSFTTPGIFTGYNQVIDIFKNVNFNGATWEDVRAKIRSDVKHYAPRQYANSVIDTVSNGTTKTTQELLTQCVTHMENFLKDNDGEIQPAIFSINCKNGQATGCFVYRNKSNNETTSIENVGDMVYSDYLTIKERNAPDENGYIQPWEEGKNYSHRVNANCTLENFNLQYKYLYL